MPEPISNDRPNRRILRPRIKPLIHFLGEFRPIQKIDEPPMVHRVYFKSKVQMDKENIPKRTKGSKALRSENIDGVQAEFLEEHHNYIAYKFANQTNAEGRRREADGKDTDENRDLWELGSKQKGIARIWAKPESAETFRASIA